MLATITKTNIDIVRSAIKIFTQLQMMEVKDDGTYYMTDVRKMTGSETYWAQKKREQKEREQNEIAKCNVGNFPIESNAIPMIPSKSKSKSIDKEYRVSINNNSASTKADIEKFFESIWTLYPVKKGKGQVSAAKKEALFKIGFDEMQRAIDRYLQGLEKDSSWRKPQNGSTFFNSGYVDYLDANYSPDKTPDKPKQSARPTGYNTYQQRDESSWADLEKRAQESLYAEKKASDDP